MSNLGSPVRPVYHSKVLPDGRIELEEVGKEDFQSYINSFKDSCNIELLVARAVNGDPTALMRKQAFYGDFTSLPKTYAEMLQTMNDAKVFFDGLSIVDKAKFDNDFNKFIAGMDNFESLKAIGLLKEDVADQNEVKESVNNES